MTKRNSNFSRLEPNYLFAQMHTIAKRYRGVLDLSVGDTSQPIFETITRAMEKKARELSTAGGYTGYGKEHGNDELREKIAAKYNVDADEVFISDGAKSDIGRLQLLFGKDVSIAVQDPTYPAYVDTGILLGQKEIIFLPCTKQNNFFPKLQKADLIYFCSPNNPTGHAATKEELTELVNFARENQSIIIFDSAYAAFIQDDRPRSIYEIPGAKEVAIEISSFSKSYGFTGVRLGWTIVPKELKYCDNTPVHHDFLRVINTFFNGASNVVQAGGLAALDCDPAPLIDYYKENARILGSAFEKRFYMGGDHAPYLFVEFGKDSWQEFEKLLEKTAVLGIPGSGFGPSGEGFLRFSALAKRSVIEEAADRIHDYLCAAC